MANISKIKLPNGTTYDIKDASVPSWAKQRTKPTYDSQEIYAQYTGGYGQAQHVQDALDDIHDYKQDTLVSGTNLKTVNNESLLGSGNITIEGGSGTVIYDGDSTTDTPYDNLFMETVASGVESLIVGGVDFQLLWTNGSPSSSFAGQTVSVSLIDYDYIGIIFKRANETMSLYRTPMFILKVGTTWYYDDQIGGYLVERSVQTTATSVVFGASSRMTTYPNGSRTTDNTKQIPYQIFGVKSAIAVSGQAKVKLEWTNPTPTDSFSGDTKISFDTTQYSSIHIFYHQTNGTGVNGYSITICDRTGANYLVMSYGSKMYKRSARIYDDGILFGDCTYGNTYGATTDTADNTKMIPYTIFGIR